MIQFTTAQKKAIDTIDDHLQIIACAGSGKTGVVTERIVNILKTKKGVKPANIVAFTFTEKAANELKSRINTRVKAVLGDVYGMAEMYVGTIHGYCLNLLQEHYPEFQKYTVLDEVRNRLFVDKHNKEIGFDKISGQTKDGNALHMQGFKDSKLFLDIVNILRESELTGEIDPVTLGAMEKYEALLKEKCFFDFTSVMTTAIDRVASDENLRTKLKSSIKYLTVDEYQDVNPVQEKLINLLFDLGANLCVVGDDDQTIYQWRGSEINNILTFQERYKLKECTVYLDENFRSSAGVVDIGRYIVRNNSKRMAKTINHKSDVKYEEGDTVIRECASQEEENAFIAERIAELHQAGMPYRGVAVLIRAKKLAGPLTKVLESLNIPFIVEGVNELFETKEAKACVAIFEYLKELQTESDLIKAWRGVVPGLNDAAIKQAVAHLARTWKVEDHQWGARYILQKIFQDFIIQLDLKEPEGVRDSRLEIIMYNLGKFSQIIDDYESINFLSLPKSKITYFCNFLKYTADSYYPEGHLQNAYIRPDAVRIMTIHQAKGLQFPAVFIPGLTKNLFPGKRHGGISVWHFLERDLVKNQERYESGDEEDERRLFYVAVTRAQKFLFMTRAPYTTHAKDISNFIKEARKSLFCIEYSSEYDYSKRIIDPGLLVSEEEEILLNFSVLDDYYYCPYRFKLTYFYGFVQPLDERIGYGRSLHNVVMQIHQQYLECGTVHKDEIPAMFEENFYLPHANRTLAGELREKGEISINLYYDEQAPSFKDIEMVEKIIELDLGDGIRVNGRIDLIKRKDLGGEKTIIVDFKTANKPIYENVSEEQLKIYALGYEHLSGKKADLMQFYNLDKNEQIQKKISSEDLKTTVTRIQDAAREIRGNKLEKRCDPARCKTCYASHLCLNRNEQKKLNIKL